MAEQNRDLQINHLKNRIDKQGKSLAVREWVTAAKK